MKQILLILCVFFLLVISTNAGELYICIDGHGKTIITDNPRSGMRNCVLKDSVDKPSSEEPSIEEKKAVGEKEKTSAKKQDTDEEREKRINNCIDCCNNKIDSCYNYTGDSRLCMAENQSCVATCKSEGSSPSSWSDCWARSKK
ncbi:MAG: hypothetical protein ABFD75_07085 [Smithella sp.]